jgi:hypothetical protein
VYCTFVLKQSLVSLGHYEVILYKFWPLFDNLAIFKAANFPSRFSNFKKLVLSYAWPKNRPPGHSAPFSSAVAAIYWFIPHGSIIDMEHRSLTSLSSQYQCNFDVTLLQNPFEK